MAKSSRVKEASAAYSGDPSRTGNSDSKGRLVLGPKHANKMFRISEQPDGNLLLEPVVAVHEREVWFYRNQEVQGMVQEGIRQSRAGKGKHLGSFAKFAESVIED